MEVVTARDFRANQSKILKKAKEGESVLLTSRIGTFKIVPISEDDSLTSKIAKSLRDVEKIEKGELPKKTLANLIDEL